jgi:hypothetical protein
MANSQIFPSSSFPGYGDLLTTPGSPATTVTGLQTYPVSNFAPQSGQILTFVQGAWTPEAPQGFQGFQGPQGPQGPSNSASFSGSGAFMLGPGIRSAVFLNESFSSINANNIDGVRTANQVVVYLFQLDVSLTISKVSVMATNNSLGEQMTFGIYSYTGTKLVDGGSFNAATSPTVQTNTISPVTLSPGIYWHAQASVSNGTGATILGILASASVVPEYVANSVRCASASNTLSAGVLPATLGSLSGFTPNSSNGDGPCCPLYE